MRHRNIVFTTLAALAISSAPARADKLDDFKAAVAASRPSCKTIPYSDLQSTCVNEGSPMHDWCDGKKGPVSCGAEGISRTLINKLDKEKATYEALKEKKRTLEDKKSRSSDDKEKSALSLEIEAADKQMYDQNKAIDAAKDELAKRKELVSNGVYNLDKCIAHRRAVMNSFASALDRVRNENEDQIKPLAQQLKVVYEEEKRGHEIAITNKINAWETCKTELRPF